MSTSTPVPEMINPLDEDLCEQLRSGTPDSSVVTLLLEQKANINKLTDEERLPPLLLAIDHGHEQIAISMIQFKANPNIRHSDDKSTALLKALGCGMKDLAKVILELDGDQKIDLSIRDNAGQSAALLALKNGDEAAFQLIEAREGGLASLSKTNAFGFSVLAQLAHSGDVGTMRQVLPYVDINQQLEDGWTALFWACAAHADTVDSVRVLLDTGLVERLLACDTKDNSLLHVAVKHNNPKTLQYLLQANNGALLDMINIKNDAGDCALMIASKQGYLECTKLLIENGARINIFDQSKATPVIWAARGGHEDLLVHLMDQKGTEINFQDRQGCTALHHAVMAGHRHIVKLLLSRGADARIENDARKFPSEIAPDEMKDLFE